MVYATYETILACLTEILFKMRVYARTPLCTLYHYKAYGTLFYHGILQKGPVYVSLIVAYVNAAYLIAVGIFRLSIDCTPAKAERTYEKIIKSPDVKGYDCQTANPQRAATATAKKALQGRHAATARTFVLPATGSSCTFRPVYGLCLLLHGFYKIRCAAGF